MGKLSSLFGGTWRAGWLALGVTLMMGIGALFVLGDSASAKPRRDRFNDGPFGNYSSSRDNDARGSSDTSSRGSSDSGSSGRGNSSGGNGNNSSGNSNNSSGRDSSSKDDNGKADKANDKNAKAKDKDNDDDDDDGRGAPQRDAGRGQGRTAGGKGNDADPPKTVVEMLQRMFPAGASGTGDGIQTVGNDKP